MQKVMWIFGTLLNTITTIASMHIILNNNNDDFTYGNNHINYAKTHNYGDNDDIDCNETRLQCINRSGCGYALEQYTVACSSLIYGPKKDTCPEECKLALITLTSTDEGQKLMNCHCPDNECNDIKERLEVCRPDVMFAVQKNSIVSCGVAENICLVDVSCGTALKYYYQNCKALFQGKKCTFRCLNSLSILQRQDKSVKLATCRCDGSENYNCPQMKSNLARLCFNKSIDYNLNQHEIVLNRTEFKTPSSSIYFQLSRLCFFFTMLFIYILNFDSQ